MSATPDALTVTDGAVVSISYTLSDDAGEVIESSKDGGPMSYLHGVGQIVPGLERALGGRVVGDRLDVVLTPEDGYGEHDPARVLVVDRDQLGGATDIAPGMQFEAEDDDGDAEVVIVTHVDGDRITLDGNHPLAGATLRFSIEVVAIRAATPDELRHGHAHDPGHEHH